MTKRTGPRLRLRAGARCADPLHAADQGLLRGAGLWRALRVGALRARAVPAAEEAAGAEPRRRIVTTAAPYQPDKGDQGPGAPYNSAAKFYQVYSGDTAQDHDLRISHVGIDRKHTTAEDPGTWFPLPELRRAAAARPHRRGRAALPRAADQPQPPRDARGRLPGDRGALQGRRRRCGDPRRQLPRLPPEHQPRRARAGGGRHPHRGDGLRQGHRRVRRRAAPAVLRLPARQCGGPAQGPGLAGLHAGACAEGAGDGAGRAHHRAVAARRGAPAPTGSSTSRTSRACRPRRSPAAAPSSTSRSRWPRACARTWA